MNIRKMSLFIATSSLLVACNSTTEVEPDKQSVPISESSQVIESISESVSEEIQEESSSTLIEESVEENFEESSKESSEEVLVESSQESFEDVTELNSEETTLIERAKAAITEATGYSEGDYLFLIHPIEDQIATIEVREDGEEVASMIGMFRYNDETQELQEMDLLTGEYVTYPVE